MMPQMTLLQALYKHQKADPSSINEVTSSTVNLTEEVFHTALVSLQEHNYIKKEENGVLQVTKKGCMLAKELDL